MPYPKLTIRGLQVRAVDAPLANPIRTAVGEVPSAPLVLIDISTEEGVTGRSYLFAYTPVTLRSLVHLMRDLEPELVGKTVAPFERIAREDHVSNPSGIFHPHSRYASTTTLAMTVASCDRSLARRLMMIGDVMVCSTSSR